MSDELPLHVVSGETGAEVRVFETFVVKVHRWPGSWQREHAAYRQLASLLSSVAPSFELPHLVDACEAEHSLTLSRVRGCHRETGEIALPAWERAGRVLAEFHRFGAGAGGSHDTMSMHEAFSRRLQAIESDLPTELSDELRIVVQGVRRALARCESAGAPRVFCHRDFRPRNLLWSNDVEPALIDLEHARWDFPAVDFARLPQFWPSQWPAGCDVSRADALRAFQSGYAERFALPEPAEIEIGAALFALGTFSWGLKHRNDARYQEGLGLVRDRAAYYQRET